VASKIQCAAIGVAIQSFSIDKLHLTHAEQVEKRPRLSLFPLAL
jgi:hypothetical protein